MLPTTTATTTTTARPKLFDGFFQLAYVTTDLEQAMATFKEHYGVERYLTIPMDTTVDTPAGPRATRLRISFAYAGDTQIELIQPLEGNTVELYWDGLPRDSATFALRFHHMAFMLPSRAAWDAFRASLAATPERIAFESPFDAQASQYLYLDAKQRLGHYTEYMWLNNEGAGLFASIPR
jgi:hypothetical protein